MKRKKHLKFNQFSCNWDTERISFSKVLSKWLYEGGYEYAIFSIIKGKPHLMLTKEKFQDRVSLYYSNYTGGEVRAQVYTKPLARNILTGCGVEEESWYLEFEDLKIENLGKFIPIKLIERMDCIETKVCAKCGKELPVSEYYAKGNGLQAYCKECMKEHSRLKNGTTGEYRVDLSKVPAQQLYDELKARGFSGQMEWVLR